MQEKSEKSGNIIVWIFTILAVGFLIALFLLKGNLNDYLSKNIKLQSGDELTASTQHLIDSLYNYSISNSTYQITFLEFGAKGCVACRKMEDVMKKVQTEFPETVKVVFLNILKPENQVMMKYYGVSAIPTQILLNQEAGEYYRHTGFISFDDLRAQFD